MAQNRDDYPTVTCGECGMEHPEDLKTCVRCLAPLPTGRPKSFAMIPGVEIPPNPAPQDIDFDKDGETYVVVFLINMKDDWFKLSREEQISLTREHVGRLSIYADKIHRTLLRGEGLSKYDYVEIIEANDLKIVNSLSRAVRQTAKASHMEFVDTICTIKGKNVLFREGATE